MIVAAIDRKLRSNGRALNLAGAKWRLWNLDRGGPCASGSPTGPGGWGLGPGAGARGRGPRAEALEPGAWAPGRGVGAGGPGPRGPGQGPPDHPLPGFGYPGIAASPGLPPTFRLVVLSALHPPRITASPLGPGPRGAVRGPPHGGGISRPGAPGPGARGRGPGAGGSGPGARGWGPGA